MLYSDEQRAIAEEAGKILVARSDQAALLGYLEATGEWDRELWRLAAEQGWTAIGIPEEQGGIGLGLTEQGLIAQAWGAQPAGCPYLAPHAALAAALLASDSGNSGDWLERLASGGAKAALAFAEGFECLPVLPAVSVAGARITGVKESVPGGADADVALVWARDRNDPVLALVDLQTVNRNPVETFDNSRLVADLAFADAPCEIVASGDEARAIAWDVLGRAAVVAAHEQVGGAEALLTIARDYAVTRKAFGQPIGAFQSIKHRLAELYGLIEVARANCIHAASREGHADFLRAAAAARISATEAYDTAARDGIQIHGGIGVTWESGLHLHMRRARSQAVELGNMLFWEDVLAQDLTGVDA